MTDKITGLSLARANGLARTLASGMRGSASHDETDRYNGALLRTDERLARLMKAYSNCDDALRDELVRVAELMVGIVQRHEAGGQG